MNPYRITSDEYSLHEEQILFNLPILIYACNHVYNIMKNENRTKLLLTTRDCVLFGKIFNVLYPDIMLIRFNASRLCYYNPDDNYLKYIKNIYGKDNVLILDLYGSCNSMRFFFEKHFGEIPRIHYIIINRYAKLIVELSFSFNIDNDDVTEDFNLDTVGTLIRIENNIEIRAPNEYKHEIVKNIHNIVDSFIDFIKLNNINIPEKFYEITLDMSI